MERVFEIENSEGEIVRVTANHEIAADAYLAKGFEEVTDIVAAESKKK